mmetsp:Transcript_33253/g.38718  ORF Transcript_33253/g.38718 Transcript_33253/m.38718 type:complete len:143 (-) Transcript_33253:154-582(-)
MNKKEVLKKMLLRKPFYPSQYLHPAARKLQNQMTEPLEPLKYKLKEVPKDLDDITEPLGASKDIPFFVARTHTGNLPVYRKYRHGRTMKRTVIRLITGDVEEFKKELSKVTSNSEVYEKVGRVEVKGLHKQSVLTWLAGLGF